MLQSAISRHATVPSASSSSIAAAVTIARWLTALSLTALFVVTLGCAEANVRRTAAKTPPVPDDELGYTDPRRRSEALTFLSAEADELDPAEQQRISARLAAAIDNEDDPLIRQQTAVALGGYQTDSAMAGLRTAMADDQPLVRMAACESLGRRAAGGDAASTGAVDLLTSALAGDDNIDVRLAAARALGAVDSPRAVDGLVAALSDSDPALRHRAGESLKSATGENFDSIDAWRTYAAGRQTGQSAANIAQQPTRLF
ncbi:MAG: HEAT repeat domain-containing protein [Planctomycetales bacterium]|nr:HEAT repeat domain-containing protein [Planctomycetales bacterium]